VNIHKSRGLGKSKNCCQLPERHIVELAGNSRARLQLEHRFLPFAAGLRPLKFEPKNSLFLVFTKLTQTLTKNGGVYQQI
jgi:hypothetical protein